MNIKKILILGGSSFVGRHLSDYLGFERTVATYNRNPIEGGIYFESLTMDLLDIVETPHEFSHAVILLGDTKPDSCFLDIPKSQALNVNSIENILKRLTEMNIKPVFASSHFVFDGLRGGYDESDQPSPILKYAEQKVEVEEFIDTTSDDYLIFRLAQVYGMERGDNTLFTNWLSDMEGEKTSYCAEDYISCPIYVGDVARCITKLIDMNASGVFHMGSQKPFSRLELYQILASQLDGQLSEGSRVVACSIHDFDMVEKRPRNISMNSDKLINFTGIQLKDVESACVEIAKLYTTGKAGPNA